MAARTAGVAGWAAAATARRSWPVLDSPSHGGVHRQWDWPAPLVTALSPLSVASPTPEGSRASTSARWIASSEVRKTTCTRVYVEVSVR